MKSRLSRQEVILGCLVGSLQEGGREACVRGDVARGVPCWLSGREQEPGVAGGSRTWKRQETLCPGAQEGHARQHPAWRVLTSGTPRTHSCCLSRALSQQQQQTNAQRHPEAGKKQVCATAGRDIRAVLQVPIVPGHDLGPNPSIYPEITRDVSEPTTSWREAMLPSPGAPTPPRPLSPWHTSGHCPSHSSGCSWWPCKAGIPTSIFPGKRGFQRAWWFLGATQLVGQLWNSNQTGSTDTRLVLTLPGPHHHVTGCPLVTAQIQGSHGPRLNFTLGTRTPWDSQGRMSPQATLS